jgi:hypothetical protein
MRKNMPRVDHREYTPPNEIGQRIRLCFGLVQSTVNLVKYSTVKKKRKYIFFILIVCDTTLPTTCTGR